MLEEGEGNSTEQLKQEIRSLYHEFGEASDAEVELRNKAEQEFTSEFSGTITIKKGDLDIREPWRETSFRPDDEIEVKIKKDDSGNPEWFIRNKTIAQAQKPQPPEGIFTELSLDQLNQFIGEVDDTKIGTHKLKNASRDIDTNPDSHKKIYGFVTPENKIAGVVTLQESAGKSAYIGDLATDPNLENSGIGTSILTGLKQNYDSLDLNPVQFSLNRDTQDSQNRLIRFYKQNGFVGAMHWSNNREISLDDQSNAGEWQNIDPDLVYTVSADTKRIGSQDIKRKTMQVALQSDQVKEVLSDQTKLDMRAWQVQFGITHGLEVKRERLSQEMENLERQTSGSL